MTTKHTPGPWRAEGWENLIVNSRNGWTILACPGGSDRASLEELKANSRLIAAAPELLDVVTRLRNGLQDMLDRYRAGNEGIDLQNDDEWISSRIALADAAIAKAEGAQ